MMLMQKIISHSNGAAERKAYRDRERSIGLMIAARFSRGNIAIQQRRLIDEDGLEALRERGEKARNRIFNR